MASSFDDLDEYTARKVREYILRGDSLAEIRRTFDNNISAKALRTMRDEVFEPLRSDPQRVKDLASGPLLNANEIVRWKGTRQRRSGPDQIEMFPA